MSEVTPTAIFWSVAQEFNGPEKNISWQWSQVEFTKKPNYKEKNKPIFVDNSQEEVEVSKPISYYYFDLEEPEMAQQAVREKKYLGLDIEPEI